MPSIATLGYHEVTDDPSQSGFQRPLAAAYKHTRKVFDQHLDVIAHSRLRPELVVDVDFTGGGEHLLLTFDDGGKSALYISDALCKRNWRGHFLITTGLIGSRTFLGRADVVQLRRCGHIVGSHSHTHPDLFNKQSPEAMKWQWRVSCDMLSQLLGEACIVASVPGGDMSPAVVASAMAADIRYLFTSEPWLSPRRAGDGWVLGRAAIKTSTSLARVRALTDLRRWGLVLFERRSSVLVRTALGPLYNLYVRRRTLPT